MFHFVCPVCKKVLEKRENSYICENLHSFDISKYGYVNLLMLSGKNKIHGDDKAMILAREDFLKRGFYDRLSDFVAAIADENCPADGVVVDAGCGEGKYTADVARRLKNSGKNATVVGIDISKDAVRYAGKKGNNLHLAVASTASMPLPDGCADVIINIFAPFSGEEFSRILADDGIIIRVYPLSHHLWELKKLIYDVPYENPEPSMEEEGFFLESQHRLEYEMKFCTNDEIMSLFAMTPYFYRTGEKDKEKLKCAEKLTCRAQFGISVYKKK